MAELILSKAASAIARAAAPSALKSITSNLARRAGAALGRSIDRALFDTTPSAGARLTEIHLQGASEGESIPLVYGRMRIAGQVIWAARFKSRVVTEKVGSGKSTTKRKSQRYTVSFAVGLCAGVATGIGRVWANGAPLDTSRLTWRFHPGAEDQAADPLIEAVEAAGQAPAYRGLAYVVFEDMPLDDFGDTIPQLAFEVWRAPPAAAVGSRLEDLVRGVCMIPGAGEFVYATDIVRRDDGLGVSMPENAHVDPARANVVVALDDLEKAAPACRHVTLVVGWFGTDLRAGQCAIKPGVELRDKATSPLTWSVGPVTRASAHLVSQIAGAPAYGGTPCDASVVQAIAELKRRGFSVALTPFVFMDIPAGSSLPDPSGTGTQAAYPWRGRIRPAAADKTAAVASEIAAFFGACTPAHFSHAGGSVSYSGPAEWSYRRFVLHMAHLAALAGGVDAFYVGSELRGVTTARDAASSFPAVAKLKTLAADVRAILGAGTKLSYAADWSEYAGVRATDGSNDVYFHLDPLWADANIDAVAIDWYPPLTDWRDGASHLDAQIAESIDDAAYLGSRIEGGEAFDWFYANGAARTAQTRSTITDGAYGEPWVFRAKDLRSFWSNAHYDRPLGVRASSPTAWIPRSKPIWLAEYGVPAVDKGPNAPNLFVDPKSVESSVPPFSNGARDDVIQRRALEALLRHWSDDALNPAATLYAGRMIDLSRSCAWAWDARPYPAFPERADVWSDGPAWTLGHWLNGRLGLGDLADVVTDICARVGVTAIDVGGLAGVVAGYVVDAPSAGVDALEPLFDAYAFSCVDRSGVLTFRHDGRGALTTITLADMLADPAPALHREPLARPADVRVRYVDPARDYRFGVAVARHPDPLRRGVRTIDAPLALSPAHAQALGRAILARDDATTLTFALPPSRLAFEPADRVVLDDPAFAGTYRIDAIRDDGARHVTLAPERLDPAWRAIAVAAGPPNATRSVPAVEIIDAPALPWTESDPRPLAAATASPWRGADLYVGQDRVTATLRGQVVAPTVIGRLQWPLYRGPVGRWDRGNVLRIAVQGGALASASDAAVLDGANIFAVRQPDGRWEILQAATITLVAPGVYDLSRLLRGLAGTEDAMADPAPAGATIVALDPSLETVDMRSNEIGAPLSLWTVEAGAPLAEAATAQSFTWRRAWARPLAPVHLRARRQASGDVALSWIRRARLGGDTWEGADPPLGEDAEAYQIEILNGASVVRTVTSTTPAWVYPLASQVADFGAAPSVLNWRVAQLSTSYGPGGRGESASPL